MRIAVAAAVAIALSCHSPLHAQTPERQPGFEVASVKKNVSGESRMGMQVQPGGRFIATNVPVRFLIATAFKMIDPEALVPERILKGPDWIADERYDINARAVAAFPLLPPGNAPEELLAMIRSILEDRFKLAAHRETRELPVFDLVVARADRRLGPGLRAADIDCDALIAAARAGATPPAREPGTPPPCGLMSGPARTIAGGATMTQLAMNLMARVERPVVDKTGLTGRFAFELVFTPERMPTGTPPPGIPPVDPNGPSLYTALQEQLGLKLVSTKGPVDVLVIDSVSRPTPD